MLLILAGVSISIVVGDNGVLTQAQNAAVKTNEAKAKEDVEMALASAQAEYLQARTTNANVNPSNIFTKSKLNGYIGGEGEIIDLKYNEGETSILKYKIGTSENTYYFDKDLK